MPSSCIIVDDGEDHNSEKLYIDEEYKRFSCQPQSTSVHLGFSEPISSGTNGIIRVGHRSENTELWDGGQIGGKPSWLNPQHVPKTIVCQRCHGNNRSSGSEDSEASSPSNMSFVCQLYAPRDDGPPNENTMSDNMHSHQSDSDRAFHRSLYVFVCRTCCTRSDTCTGAIRVLRAQLPSKNPYYGHPNKEDNDNEEDDNESDNDNDNESLPRPHVTARSTKERVHLCAVCGLQSTRQCPRQREWFCTRNHQIEFHKYAPRCRTTSDALNHHHHHLSRDEVELSMALPSLFPLSELVVEDEPPPIDRRPRSRISNSTRAPNTLFPSPVEETDDDDDDNDIDSSFPENIVEDADLDSDQHLSQEDLNAIVQSPEQFREAIQQDYVTAAFFDRIQNRPHVQSQCIRYACYGHYSNNCNGIRDKNNNNNDNNIIDTTTDDNNVLWMSEQYIPSADDIPACENCGAARRFEFQIMPQLVHYLHSSATSSSTTTIDSSTPATLAAAKPTPTTATATATATAETLNRMKQALHTTQAWIEQTPPEHIPPALIETREHAIQQIKNHYFGGSLSANNNNNKNDNNNNSSNCNSKNKEQMGVVEWGVIAVYTCSASCDVSSHDDSPLGAYVEEFAWKQPPLDAHY